MESSSAAWTTDRDELPDLPWDVVPAPELDQALRLPAPPGLAAALADLEHAGVLVLVGARTAALHLLAGLVADRLVDVVREVEPEPGAGADAELLLADERVAYMVELDEAEVGGEWGRFCRHALALASDLRERAVRLVVRTGVDCGWTCPGGADPPVVRLDGAAPWPAGRDGALAGLRPWFEGGRDALGHADPAERALLIATAVLGDRRPAEVWRAARRLLELIRAADEAPGPLAGPGLGTRLAEVPTRPDALDSVWREYPELRAHLVPWLITFPDAARATEERLSAVLGDLVIGQQDTTFLAVVAAAGRAASRRVVAQTLSRTACDPGMGRAVRRRLHDWAGARGVEPAVRAAVAGACALAVGLRYPRGALRRLRRLATSPEPPVLTAMADAIVGLATEPALRRCVLEELAGWRTAPDARRRHAGSAAFLALARAPGPCGDPLLLAGPGPGRHALVAAWRDVLGTPGDWPEEELDAAVAAWLDVAARPVPDEAPLFILAAATNGDAVARRVLLRSAHRWGERWRHNHLRRAAAGRLYELVVSGRQAAR